MIQLSIKIVVKQTLNNVHQPKKKDEYIKRMVKNAMKEATPELSNHYGENLNELQEIKMVNKAEIKLFINIYNLSSYFNQLSKHISICVSKAKFTTKYEFAEDWMVITKVKSSFFNASASSELHYIKEKIVKEENIIEVISKAFEPVILGHVLLPERMVNIISNWESRH